MTKYGRHRRDHHTPMHPAIKRYEHGHIITIINDVEDYLSFPVYSGGTRKAYVGDVWVYKVPHNSGWSDYQWGYEQNALEASIYQDMVDGKDVPLPVAECYLLPDGVLKMRRVQTCYNLKGAPDVRVNLDTLPEWTEWADSRQVGYLEGELVAYDV
jgi:hypothetical protein